MKNVLRKINEVIRNAGAALGRLLGARPAPTLRPIPIYARRRSTRR
jgi:hypothetical protein